MEELKAHCKINLGLRVVRRRPDGFHDIETVMMPVPGLYDTVSVTEMPSPEHHLPLTPAPYPAPTPVFPAHSVLEISGDVEVDCPVEQNICMRALRLMQQEYGIGEAAIALQKNIPTGAGLGGGSADAAAVLHALNREFALELSNDELEGLGARLGSDVPFFVRALAPRGGAQLCTGRGEMMTPVEVDLSGMWIAIAKPTVSVSTAEAYAGIRPYESGKDILNILSKPIREWKGLLVNDFEETIFALHPQIADLRNSFYAAGALYAAMSGSGSAVFAIFDQRPESTPNVWCHVEHIRNGR
jgi:4-diphosphocytidyl-2-C-methyl-D-erythritol kinase